MVTKSQSALVIETGWDQKVDPSIDLSHFILNRMATKRMFVFGIEALNQELHLLTGLGYL